MPGLLVTGVNSRIVKELELLSHAGGYDVTKIGREMCNMRSLSDIYRNRSVFTAADRIVLTHGTLNNQPFLERTEDSIQDSLSVNLTSVVAVCEMALQENNAVRIAVIGSESASKGSYDIPYWLSKSALHAYVQNRRLDYPAQQLVCIAPSFVSDSGMTYHKTPAEIEAAVRDNPKRRGVLACEVARLVHFLLFSESGYVTNTIVEMNGGKFARHKR